GQHRGGRPAAARQLPRVGVALVPQHLLLPPAAGADGRCRHRLPAARPRGVPAVRHLAVHPAGPRVQRAAGLPDPSLHRLPQPGRPAGCPAGRARLGTRRRRTAVTGGTAVPERVSRQAWTMLAVATIGFAVNFWAWALISPLGAYFTETLGLSAV